MPERRFFIQHMGGDPFLIRYVRLDSYDAETSNADWTEHPSERHEWVESSEAHAVRNALKCGVVLPTCDAPPPDIDAEAKRNEQRHHPQPPPNEPIPDKELPWWMR